MTTTSTSLQTPSVSPLYLLLTGDIGGTNSRMALYETTPTTTAVAQGTTGTGTDSIPKPIVEKYYRNSEHITNPQDPNIFATTIIIPFLQHCFEEQQQSITGNNTLVWNDNIQIIATFAVAGMVLNNAVRLTNLDNMLIDGNAIVSCNSKNKYLQAIIKCRIINDFVAQGYGCLTLQQHEVRPLYGTITQLKDLPNTGPKVCIGAGTGLGECYLTPNTTTGTGSSNEVSYTCYASEGGHVEYAPRNDIEIQMYQYLSNKYDSKHRISVERVVSGKGLANVYEFLSCTYPTRIIKSIHDAFVVAGDEQGRIVAQNVMNCSLCEQAMSIMMSAYGCETGSTAIKFIPTGGLFVTGGLTPKNIQYIDGLHTDFMLSYVHKGRVSPLLQHVPLFAVMVEDLGVRGAYKAAYTEYTSYIESLAMNHDSNYNNDKVLHSSKQKRQWLVQYGIVITTLLAVGSFVLLRKPRQH